MGFDTNTLPGSQTPRRTWRWIVFLGVGNFLVFLLGAMYLGGNAWSGLTVDGHYFVHEHGRLTEVSRAAFLYSQWHARSLLLTHPLVLLSAWFATRSHKHHS